VAAGADVKTAQSVLVHTDARVTLDLYSQVVTEQQQAAVDVMAERFLEPTPRDDRGMGAIRWLRQQAPNAKRGPVTRPSLPSRVAEI
jgi:hypothetical protein